MKRGRGGRFFLQYGIQTVLATRCGSMSRSLRKFLNAKTGIAPQAPVFGTWLRVLSKFRFGEPSPVFHVPERHAATRGRSAMHSDINRHLPYYYHLTEVTEDLLRPLFPQL